MMDYNYLGLAKCICLVLSLLPTTYASHNDRDIILTPDKTHQHFGKIIYFKPNDRGSTSSKQRSLKENVHTTQVPWEEPLKHATYLVLNNKIDGNSSEFVNETQLQTATYVRGAFKSYQKFGDIVSLARGRLETDESNHFVYIEMDRNECKKLNCSLNGNDDNSKNITAFWLVEKVRHRDEKQGHRYELRITIFPIKRFRLESKRDATGGGSENQPKRRSFLIREQDYPKYFDETMKPSGKIQKRFFDLVGSLSENPYEEYQIPFSVGGGGGRHINRYSDDLNTGEYYHPKRNGEQLYQRPFATTSSYGGSHVQFPDASVATKDFLEATRTYPINPFTATHLHHHYYLNRNNVPLIKATGYEKETIYENPSSDDYRTPIHARNPQIDAEVSTQIQQQSDRDHSTKEHHQQEPNVSPQNNPVPTAVGLGYNFYTEQPRNVYDVSDSSGILFGNIGNHQSLQTPYSLSDQVPAPPLQFGQYYQQQSPYTHPLQLQVVTPPHQQYLSNGHENAPITAAPFNLRQQYQLEPFRPVIDFPSRFNRQQFPIQNNDVNGNYNQQFEPNRYSEPDPIYHGESLPLPPYQTRQVGFDPVIDIGNHQTHQQSTPTTTPNSNQIQVSVKPEKQTELKDENGEFEINPSNAKKRPERQRVKTQSKGQQQQQQQQRDRNENQTNYPDSINAQLPPPEQDDDLTVPYVESSVITQTSVLQQQSTSAEPNDYPKQSTGYEKPKRIRPRGYYGPRTTTEKPILKWMPKKTKAKGSITIIESPDENASTVLPSTTEAVYTVTPVNTNSEEPRTSISTSISVQVGTASSEAKTTVSSSEQSTNHSQAESRESEDYTGFLPTIIPDVQLVRGKTEAVNTNQSNLKLFRSGEVDSDAEDDHVAQSIISHARGL